MTTLAADRFDELLGSRRGSGRKDAGEDAPLGALPYRTVQHRNRERVYDPTDALVTVCERCGDTGFLLRDWDSVELLPAMCCDCHSELGTDVATDGFCCEDWCAIDLDHSGLCRPR